MCVFLVPIYLTHWRNWWTIYENFWLTLHLRSLSHFTRMCSWNSDVLFKENNKMCKWKWKWMLRTIGVAEKFICKVLTKGKSLIRFRLKCKKKSSSKKKPPTKNAISFIAGYPLCLNIWERWDLPTRSTILALFRWTILNSNDIQLFDRTKKNNKLKSRLLSFFRFPVLLSILVFNVYFIQLESNLFHIPVFTLWVYLTHFYTIN